MIDSEKKDSDNQIFILDCSSWNWLENHEYAFVSVDLKSLKLSK